MKIRFTFEGNLKDFAILRSVLMGCRYKLMDEEDVSVSEEMRDSIDCFCDSLDGKIHEAIKERMEE